MKGYKIAKALGVDASTVSRDIQYLIYTIESNKEITWFHKLTALKLAKECNEALFRLTAEGPFVMHVKSSRGEISKN